MKKVMLTIMLAFITVSMFAQIPVTFQVKMNAQIYRKLFTPGKDSLVMRGAFQTDAGDTTGNWAGYFFKLTDTEKDSVYSITINFPNTSKDVTYEYKFVSCTGSDGWEGVDNRKFTVTSPSTVLAPVWFNNDSTYKTTVTNTVKFVADLSKIWGTGPGSFDVASDSLIVDGLNWDGLGTLISTSAERTLKQVSPLTPKVFAATLTFKGALGDSTKWKFHAYPEANFSNSGYETGNDRWLKYQADGTTTTLSTIFPNIYPAGSVLTKNVTYYFQCDVVGAVNKHNGQIIDISKIDFVGLRGGNKYVGSWSSGSWAVTDTTGNTGSDTTAYMRVMYDDGARGGDLVAKDNKWTTKVVFPAGTTGGAIEFKFAAHYPGADTAFATGGGSPLDNEGGFGENHMFLLQDASAPIWMRMGFGNFVTEVKQVEGATTPKKYTLNQNYPNPFNPSTVIKYSVPVAGMVSLKIYNVVGQLVGDLVDMNQTAGTYTATFDASRLSSGVYFYTLKAGSFTSTKKMMLIK